MLDSKDSILFQPSRADSRKLPPRLSRDVLAFQRGSWQTLRVIIGLFPELDAPGGVQRAGRHLAAVLAEFAASRGMDYRLLSLNDSPELHRMTAAGREFVFTGCERGKARFTATALRTARRHAKLVLAAHPNLGPVVQAMRVAAPKLKSIICTHGIEVWEPLPGWRRRALRHANLVLAPSQDTANQVASQQQVLRERIRVLPWALDPQFEALLATVSKTGLPENFPAGRVILTVGRWISTERSSPHYRACSRTGPTCNSWPWARAMTVDGWKTWQTRTECGATSIFSAASVTRSWRRVTRLARSLHCRAAAKDSASSISKPWRAASR